MKTYLDILKHILANGTEREDRTGVGTIGVFGHQARFDLRQGFPLLTTKKMPFRWIVAELLWFLSGDTNEKTLRDQGVDIWKEWATAEQCARFGREEGDLGPVYGHLWRHFGGDLGVKMRDGSRVGKGGFDQIAWVEQEIRHNPNSRRLVVSAWNPSDAQRVTLPPCHTLFQFYVGNGELSCHLYARSIDAFLGLPFNIASYALLTHMMANSTSLRVGELVISFGDLHIYKNHLAQVHEQLSREPRHLPELLLRPEGGHILAVTIADVALQFYSPHPPLKAEVAV